MAGVRAEKKERTRQHIEVVAMDLFLARGYATTTVEEIAEGAGVSVRTFYRYFASKDAVLFAGFDGPIEATCAAIRDRDRDLPVLESLQHALTASADALEPLALVLKHLWQLAAEDGALEDLTVREVLRWRTAIVAELATQSGLQVYDVHVQLVGGAVHDALRAGVAQWRGHGGRGSLADEVRAAVALLSDLSGAAEALDCGS